MRTRSALLAAVLALGACQRTPTEPSSEGRRIEIAGDLEIGDGKTGYRFDVILDGAIVTGGGTKDTSSYHYYAGLPLTGNVTGHHTLEVRVTEQPASPSPYHAWGWYLRAFDLFQPRLLGSVDLREQSVTIRTGESIRWDFDL